MISCSIKTKTFHSYFNIHETLHPAKLLHRIMKHPTSRWATSKYKATSIIIESLKHSMCCYFDDKGVSSWHLTQSKVTEDYADCLAESYEDSSHLIGQRTAHNIYYLKLTESFF